MREAEAGAWGYTRAAFGSVPVTLSPLIYDAIGTGFANYFTPPTDWEKLLRSLKGTFGTSAP